VSPKKVRGKPRRKTKAVMLPLGTHEMAQHFHRLLDTLALKAHAVGTARLSWTAGEILHLVENLVRDREHLLLLARELRAEREAEQATATVDVDTEFRRQLAVAQEQGGGLHVGAPEHVLVVRRVTGGFQAGFAATQGTNFIVYRSARHAGESIDQAIIALLHHIDPAADVAGMCDGLSKLCGGAS
jgi:hypothetical protein